MMTVMATGLNTKVALETTAVTAVHMLCLLSNTLSGLGKNPPQLLTSGDKEKVRTSWRRIVSRSAGASMENSAAISGPMAMPRK
ncbi:hypothetical protein D3C87_1714030 [compost metagenome]